MLFRKNIEPACAYCRHSSLIDDESAICVKKGVVMLWSKCRHFNYDPLKRIPDTPKKPSTEGVDPSAFEL
jgi:hypothetical protein